MVPLAEHDSSFAPWKATAMGSRRDLLGDLVASLSKVGLAPGCCSHCAENRQFHGGTAVPSDVQDPTNAALHGPAQREEPPPSPEPMRHSLCRSGQVVDRYRPRLMWLGGRFNGIEQPGFAPYLRTFAACCFIRSVEWGSHVGINVRRGAMPADVGVNDRERGQLADITQPSWQTDTAVARSTRIHIPDATPGLDLDLDRSVLGPRAPHRRCVGRAMHGSDHSAGPPRPRAAPTCA